VGTGAVQVNVTWDLDVDVDLHVLDPRGEEIYYDHRRSASGGVLRPGPGCSRTFSNAGFYCPFSSFLGILYAVDGHDACT
jgi:hypothetical protein